MIRSRDFDREGNMYKVGEVFGVGELACIARCMIGALHACL